MAHFTCQIVIQTTHDHVCGNRTTRAVADTHPLHLHLCGVHKRTYQRDVALAEGAHHVAGRCYKVCRGPWEGEPLRRAFRWCPGASVAGSPYCAAHEARRQIWAADHPQPPLAPLIPDPPRAAGLAAFVRDAQNVHTRIVAEQTNGATAMLLSYVVPEDQQTEKRLALAWLVTPGLRYTTFLAVAADINRWFNTPDCRALGDNLYRRLLRGLVARLRSEPDQERAAEMYKRAWEECVESVGLCCEGHISRLCNVLVGFDDAFQPPVPFGEILQSKMSAIAAMDIPDDEKRRQAMAFFDEHKTPAADRVAWLEAF